MSFTLEYSDELTVRTIEGAHQLLAAALKAEPEVLLFVAPDATVDISFVQLIEAGRRAAQESGQGFALTAPAEGALHETLRRGGFLEAADSRAFWLMEGTH